MNLEDLENRINKLQNKKRRRNLELTGIVAIAGIFGIISSSLVSNYLILGVVYVACAMIIIMVILFGNSRRIRPVEVEIWKLSNGMI